MQNCVVWVTLYMDYKFYVDDVTEDVEAERLLLKGKQVTGLIKDKLGEKIMKEFVELKAKSYSQLIDHLQQGEKNQKAPKIVT